MKMAIWVQARQDHNDIVSILDPQIAGPYIDVVTHEAERQIGTAPTYKKVTLKDAPPPPGFSIMMN